LDNQWQVVLAINDRNKKQLSTLNVITNIV
jgi:hypothetical protein